MYADGDQVCRHWTLGGSSPHPPPLVLQAGGGVLQTGQTLTRFKPQALNPRDRLQSVVTVSCNLHV